MEAVPRMPMLAFELKHSPEFVEFGPTLKQYIRDHYGEDPAHYNKSCNELEQLRQSAVHVSHDFMGCSTLKKYYSQLQFLQGRFPMTELGEASIPFTWEEVHSGREVTLNDIKFEQACILYNIGALHSILGAMDTRQSADGMKVSCTHFQCASWAFEHLRDHFGSSAMSLDMSHELLTYQVHLMLAQAQECILEKSMTDSRKSTITAKVAAQIVEFYRTSLKHLDTCNSQELISSKQHKEWKKRIDIKILFYTCITNFYLGRQAEDQQKWGQCLAYYTLSLDKLGECQKSAKNESAEIQESLRFTNDVVGGKHQSAKKDNDFVYHEKIPDLDSLPEVKGASLVKGIPFNPNDPEISGPDVFMKLVPMSAHEASSLYSEEKATLLRRISSDIQEKNDELSKYLSSLQLDQTKLNPEPERLPQQLLEKCAALSVRPNAIKDLVDSMAAVSNVSTEVDCGIREIQQLLQEESKAELEYQDKFGKRATNIILSEIAKECAMFEVGHKKGSQSNTDLHKAMNTHINNLKLLSSPLDDLQKLLPSLDQERDPESADVIKQLNKLLSKVEEMRGQREELEEQLRKEILADDITGALCKQEGTNRDVLFSEQLKKHDKITTLIKQNLSAQTNILRALTDSNAKYATVRKATSEIILKRDQMIRDLINSYDVYEDLMAKSQKGLEFYKKLETNVGRLLSRCKGVCKVQQEERELMYNRYKPKAPIPTRPAAPKPAQPDFDMPDVQGGLTQPSSGALPHPPTSAAPMPSMAAMFDGPKLKDYLPFMKPKTFGKKDGSPPIMGAHPSVQDYMGQSGSLPNSSTSSPVHMPQMPGSVPASPDRFRNRVDPRIRPTESDFSSLPPDLGQGPQQQPYSSMPTGTGQGYMPQGSAGQGHHYPAEHRGSPALDQGQSRPPQLNTTSSSFNASSPYQGQISQVAGGQRSQGQNLSNQGYVSDNQMPGTSQLQYEPLDQKWKKDAGQPAAISSTQSGQGQSSSIARSHQLPAMSMHQQIGDQLNTLPPNQGPFQGQRYIQTSQGEYSGQQRQLQGQGQLQGQTVPHSGAAYIPTSMQQMQHSQGGPIPPQMATTYDTGVANNSGFASQQVVQPHSHQHYVQQPQHNLQSHMTSQIPIPPQSLPNMSQRGITNTVSAVTTPVISSAKEDQSALPYNPNVQGQGQAGYYTQQGQVGTVQGQNLPQQQYGAINPQQQLQQQQPQQQQQQPQQYQQQQQPYQQIQPTSQGCIPSSQQPPGQGHQSFSQSVMPGIQQTSGQPFQQQQQQLGQLAGSQGQQFSAPTQGQQTVMSQSQFQPQFPGQQQPSQFPSSNTRQQQQTSTGQSSYQNPNMAQTGQQHYQQTPQQNLPLAQYQQQPSQQIIPQQQQSQATQPHQLPQQNLTQPPHTAQPPHIGPQYQPQPTQQYAPQQTTQNLPQQPTQSFQPPSQMQQYQQQLPQPLPQQLPQPLPQPLPQQLPAQQQQPNQPQHSSPAHSPFVSAQIQAGPRFAAPVSPLVNPALQQTSVVGQQTLGLVTGQGQNYTTNSIGGLQNVQSQNFPPVSQYSVQGQYVAGQGQSGTGIGQGQYKIAQQQQFGQTSGTQLQHPPVPPYTHTDVNRQTSQNMIQGQCSNQGQPVQQNFIGQQGQAQGQQSNQQSMGHSVQQPGQYPTQQFQGQVMTHQIGQQGQGQIQDQGQYTQLPTGTKAIQGQSQVPQSMSQQMYTEGQGLVLQPKVVHPSAAVSSRGQGTPSVQPQGQGQQTRPINPASHQSGQAPNVAANAQNIQQIPPNQVAPQGAQPPSVPSYIQAEQMVMGYSPDTGRAGSPIVTTLAHTGPIAGHSRQGSTSSLPTDFKQSAVDRQLSQPADMSGAVRSGPVDRQASTSFSRPVPIDRQLSTASSLDDILSSSPSNKTEMSDSFLSPKVLTAQEIQQQKEDQLKNSHSAIHVKDPYKDGPKLDKFVAEVEKLAKFIEGFDKPTCSGPTSLDFLWKELMDEQDKAGRKQTLAIARCYPMKNREQDIMPYDNSRVLLTTLKDDYINASWVNDLSPSCPKFIAAQSPLPATLIDFWLMVYEQSVEVLVALSSENEVGKKFPAYLPQEKGETIHHGTVQLTLQSIKKKACWTERILHLRHAETKTGRTLIHLHYSSWPISGFPEKISHILQFITEVHSFYRQQRSLMKPIVVHCSNGVGRTGMFLLTYVGMQEVNHGQGIINIQDVAGKMLWKRRNLLLKKDQMKYCYEALLYYAQDVLGKQGILVHKASFGDQLPKPGVKSQSWEPGEDILFGSMSFTNLQSNIAKLGTKVDSSKLDQKLEMLKNAESRKGKEKSAQEEEQSETIVTFNDQQTIPRMATGNSLPDVVQGPGMHNISDKVQEDKTHNKSDLYILTDLDLSKKGQGLSDLEKKVEEMMGSKTSLTSMDSSQSGKSKTSSLNSSPAHASREASRSPQLKKRPENVLTSLVELQDPNTFTIGTSKNIKKKTTKAEFAEKRPATEPDPNDPLSSLDPFWTLK